MNLITKVKMESKYLQDLSSSIRESTIKRLELVPEYYENWKISKGALSFFQISKHLEQTDEWLLEKIVNPNITSIKAESISNDFCNREEYIKVINKLRTVLIQKLEMLSMLDEEKLKRKIYDDRFNAEVSLEWVIMRGNLDHEIHHRGQLATYLRVLKDNNII